MLHIDGVIKLLSVAAHRCGGFTQNDAHFLQQSPADGVLQDTAASDRVPEARPGRVPITDRIGRATAPMDVKQGLKHDGPLATTWLGQQTNEILQGTAAE